MPSISALDEKTGRKFYLDDPNDLQPGEPVTFLLSLHGGGSVGAWQRLYFPAFGHKDRHRLVIATPSAATKEPVRRWVGEADDEHLRNIVGPRVRLPDIVDDKPGQVYDTTREGKSTPAWGLNPRPGVAEVYRYPNARAGRVIADVVRLDKGHTEGLEPNVTEALVKMMVDAPGGKAQHAD
jgi:hypothetical protein